MKINSRQEIAMWVFGLLWAAFAVFSLMGSTVGNVWVAFLEVIAAFVILAFLIIFSLRDRKKPNSSSD